MINQNNVRKLSPIMNDSLKNYTQGTHRVADEFRKFKIL